MRGHVSSVQKACGGESVDARAYADDATNVLGTTHKPSHYFPGRCRVTQSSSARNDDGIQRRRGFQPAVRPENDTGSRGNGFSIHTDHDEILTRVLGTCAFVDRCGGKRFHRPDEIHGRDVWIYDEADAASITCCTSHGSHHAS